MKGFLTVRGQRINNEDGKRDVFPAGLLAWVLNLLLVPQEASFTAGGP